MKGIKIFETDSRTSKTTTSLRINWNSKKEKRKEKKLEKYKSRTHDLENIKKIERKLKKTTTITEGVKKGNCKENNSQRNYPIKLEQWIIRCLDCC